MDGAPLFNAKAAGHEGKDPEGDGIKYDIAVSNRPNPDLSACWSLNHGVADRWGGRRRES